MNIKLPIFNNKDEIVKAVNSSDIVIIEAETGSGKSTQVCQYLYEAGYNVIVTQPRRIGAIYLYERVSEEMGDNRDVVGYHVAFESSRSDKTRILFCTDGLQLVKELSDNGSENKVLIIDEVHEWNLNIETLIAWIKKRRSEEWNTKVVIMSATMNQDDLLEYFDNDAVKISAKGRQYGIKWIYKREYEFIETIYEYASKGKDVLAFVPGVAEILDTIESLKDCGIKDGEGYKVLPLHANLDGREQNLCFKNYNVPKIIVSTNIAQTSITIDSELVVIDTGTEKRVQSVKNIMGIELNNISKSDCKQRAGRAGRVCDGTYILCSDYEYENRDEYQTPEIQRTLIEQVVLRLASVDIDISEVKFIHQPDKKRIDEAIKLLNNISAIDSKGITEIGVEISKMPISVRYGRMILEAKKRGVLKEVIIISAILEVGSLLKRNEHYINLTRESNSDLLAELDIFKQIENKGVREMGKMGVNIKNYYKTCDIIGRIYNIVEFENSEVHGTERDIIASICSGLIDFICVSNTTFEDEVTNINNSLWKVDNRSVVYGSYRRNVFKVGIPKIINYMDKWGNENSLTILSNVTLADESIIKELVPNSKFRYEMDNNARYDEVTDSVYTQIIGFYNDIEYKRENKMIKSGVLFDNAKNDWYMRRYGYRYSDIIKKKGQKIIEINGIEYALKLDSNLDYYIVISAVELLKIKDKRIFSDSGDIVNVICGSHTGSDIDSIRLKVLKDNEDLIKYRLSARGVYGKVINDIIDAEDNASRIGLKTVELYDGISIDFYLYYELDKKGAVRIRYTNNKDIADRHTLSSVKYLFNKYVSDRFGDKNFRFKVDGKIKVTNKTSACRDEFRNYVGEIEKDLRLDNLRDSREFISEIYREIIDKMLA